MLRFIFFSFGFCVTLILCVHSYAQNPHSPVAPWSYHDEESTRPDFENFDRRQTSPNGFGNALPRFNLDDHQDDLSAIEALYSERVVDDLEQFGYDLFGVPKDPTRHTLNRLAKDDHDTEKRMRNTPMGAVQDDFMLGSGDEIEIVFTGQRTDRGIYKINNDGLLVMDDFPPIPAAGRSIGQVRVSVEAAAKNLYNTETYISLASVRQIGVLVVGHVKRPGRQNLTVFHTVLDALMESGGIEKTGSLRQIKLIRNGRSTILDLYSLLMHGASNVDLQLRDGDRIIVPPLGPTIAVSGEVKRPGIYEILTKFQGMHHKPGKRSEKLSLNEVLEMAGGVLISGQNRFLSLSVNGSGSERVKEIGEAKAFEKTFGDGAILMVAKGQEKRSDTVELVGHTRKPGIYALEEVSTLSALLPNQNVLGDHVYPLIGVIERYNPQQLTSMYLDFPLALVMSGDFDRNLRDGDVVHLFSKDNILGLAKDLPKTAEDRYHEKYAQTKDDEDTRRNERIDIAYDMRGRTSNRREQGSFDQKNDGIDLEDNKVLSSFLAERSAFLRGAVRKPGAYPIAEGVSLENLIASAGGLTLEANIHNVEVTSINHGIDGQSHGRSGTHRKTLNLRETHPQNVMISPGDTVRINQKFKKVEDSSVLIIGEVRNPGRYDLLPGDKTSDLLNRAGGLTNQAYADGAIFSRESERHSEESRFRAAARDLERALAVAIEQDVNEEPNATQIAMVRDLSEELRSAEALGRITIEADPATLSVNPELDMLLEAGDRLYIPKRPLTVRVTGEVLSPASLQFRDRKGPMEYIHEAGGFTYHADKSRSFVLYPDGSAQPLQVRSWNYKPIFIPPGSTIVVPRDPKPFDFVESARDISQIFSNLAITGVFIDDIRDDND